MRTRIAYNTVYVPFAQAGEIECEGDEEIDLCSGCFLYTFHGTPPQKENGGVGAHAEKRFGCSRKALYVCTLGELGR